MAMNIFRLAGDMSHVASICFLFLQLWKSKNARGISVKTQELYLMVFCTRYLDLFTTFYTVYNSVLKVLFISSTAMAIFMIKYQEPIKSLYNADQDSFPHWKFLVAPSAVIATVVHANGMYGWNWMELLWTFSICLEAVTVIPQLVVLRKYRLVERYTGLFLLTMGLYRALYILNWVYRAHTERNYRHHYLVYACGVLQTLLYMDFFYQYSRVSMYCNKGKGEENDEDDEGSLIFEEDRVAGESEMATPLTARQDNSNEGESEVV